MAFTPASPLLPSQNAQSQRKQITLASLVAFFWSANTVSMALQWKIVSDVFISHGASLEDEFDFHIHGDTPASQAINIVRGLNTFLADVTLIWRCWVMYGGSLLVVAIPSLCLVTETVSVIIVTVLDTFPHSNATGINWRLVYYLMTLITNGLCTFLILFRIVRISGVGASFKTYRGIIEILVESAAIYSAIYIALLVTYAYASYTNQLVLSASSYLMMISYSIT
ncbi:hypothetical protein CPB85DRAFT_903077 [Mucidula mucida]|nr:hypothetical protein CPB85DRAFT_903077 [Mucidula mucida]